MRLQYIIPLTIIGLSATSQAITIDINYDYDDSDFFGAGNVDGAAAGIQARAALDAAASFYSNALVDDFDAITPGGSNTWSPRFTHPATGAEETISNPTIAANTVIIYAGARVFGGSTLGQGGPGGFSAGGNSAWFTAIFERGEGASTQGVTAVEFAPWGGSIAFDDVAGQWHYDHTTTAGLAGNSDFYSVALHEIGHVLGIGTADSWDTLHTGPAFGKSFTGANATAANGGVNPLLQVTQDPPGHFKNGTISTVWGEGSSQEVMMDPSITTGTRKLATDLDMAAFDDIGWDIIIVVPEPSSTLLIGIGSLALLVRRRR